MAWYDFIFNLFPGLSEKWNAIVFACLTWGVLVLIIVIAWIASALSKKKKEVDISALASLAHSDSSLEDSAPNADPKEVMAILSIERVAASTALSAVKDAQKNRRISSSVADSLNNRYKARITKIDADIKRRSGAQEYRSLAESLEQSRDRIRGEVMPSSPIQTPPPPPSSTPGIPSTAPPVPGRTLPPAPTTGPPSSSGPAIPSIPKLPTSGPPSIGTPPSTPSSPIPIPPKIPTVGPPTAKPTTVVPPSIAPPTVSAPPVPPKTPMASAVAPPTTSDLVPPAVPTSVPTTSAPPAPTAEGDSQSISGLRMEMLRELARLKKFMSEEGQ